MRMFGCGPISFEGILEQVTPVLDHVLTDAVTSFILQAAQEPHHKMEGGQIFILRQFSPSTGETVMVWPPYYMSDCIVTGTVETRFKF